MKRLMSPKDQFERQTIKLDESLYEDEDDLLYLLRKLKDAANDSRIRKEMDREDESFAAVANHKAATETHDDNMNKRPE